MMSKNRFEMQKKVTQKYPRETSFHIKKMNSGFFKLKKNIKFLYKRNTFQFGKHFSPQTHYCLNNIEVIVFISFKIIPWTRLCLFYFRLVSSSTLGNNKSTQFLRSLFLVRFHFFLPLRFQKQHQKHWTSHLSFFLSFFSSLLRLLS